MFTHRLTQTYIRIHSNRLEQVGPTETDNEGRECALLKARKKPKVEIVQDGVVVPIAVVEELQGGR